MFIFQIQFFKQKLLFFWSTVTVSINKRWYPNVCVSKDNSIVPKNYFYMLKLRWQLSSFINGGCDCFTDARIEPSCLNSSAEYGSLGSYLNKMQFTQGSGLEFSPKKCVFFRNLTRNSKFGEPKTLLYHALKIKHLYFIIWGARAGNSKGHCGK